MSNLTLFTPLMRQSVGFDRFNDLFESLMDEKNERFEAYPPYNIEKRDEDAYVITLAVAGFEEKDINIMVQDDRLVVSAAREAQSGDQQKNYLHRGIATRSFERTFRLADHIRVQDASLENGLLTIAMIREVPEEKKPRMIAINGHTNGTTKSGLLSKAKKNENKTK